jgi:hypothetical protein
MQKLEALELSKKNSNQKQESGNDAYQSDLEPFVLSIVYLMVIDCINFNRRRLEKVDGKSHP